LKITVGYGEQDSRVTATELIAKNDLMFANLLKLYQVISSKKSRCKLITIRGSYEHGKVSELSYYEMLNRQTYELIKVLNTVSKNIDSYYLEIGLYSNSNIGKVFDRITDYKYRRYEVNFQELLTCVTGILVNELPRGCYKIDGFRL
jgi:hypothetical protein